MKKIKNFIKYNQRLVFEILMLLSLIIVTSTLIVYHRNQWKRNTFWYQMKSECIAMSQDEKACTCLARQLGLKYKNDVQQFIEDSQDDELMHEIYTKCIH